MHSASSLCILIFCITAGTNAADDWDYTFQGNDWGGTCKTGKKQSPININTKWTTPKRNPSKIEFINYDVPIPVQVREGHYTINVYPQEGKGTIGITGGGLKGTYYLQHVHFHWKSEHLINSNRYPLEAHLVHIKEEYNLDSSLAISDPEGIAVLGVLFCNIGNEKEIRNYNIDKVLEAYKSQKEVTIKMSDFLPRSLDFFRYEGSLTTPGCAEAVVWTVFQNIAPISTDQIYNLKNNLPGGTKFTYRVTQALNKRKVEEWDVSSLNNPNRVGGLKGSSTNLLIAAPLIAKSVMA